MYVLCKCIRICICIKTYVCTNCPEIYNNTYIHHICMCIRIRMCIRMHIRMCKEVWEAVGPVWIALHPLHMYGYLCIYIYHIHTHMNWSAYNRNTATHCTTLQHTATRQNTMQHKRPLHVTKDETECWGIVRLCMHCTAIQKYMQILQNLT